MRREPADYAAYSDTRPDVSAVGVGKGGSLLAADLKLFDSVGGGGQPALRGAMVAFGNTRPRAREKVLGRRERGTLGTAFNHRTGLGHAAAVRGAYHRAIEVHGVDVRPLLFEVWGGFSPEVVDLIRELAFERGNRLSKSEYDQTTWSARSWSSFSVQKISVALHRAAALEIAKALNIAAAGDSRDEASTGVTRPLCRGG